MATKFRSLCKLEKPEKDYTQRKLECRECRNMKAREYYRSHKEELLEKSREYRQENKDTLHSKVV